MITLRADRCNSLLRSTSALTAFSLSLVFNIVFSGSTVSSSSIIALFDKARENTVLIDEISNKQRIGDQHMMLLLYLLCFTAVGAILAKRINIVCERKIIS